MDDMNEVFLINYTYDRGEEWTMWYCHHATHSLHVATEKARELREMGYRVNVQSILLNENGKVEL